MPTQRAPIWQAVDKLTERVLALEGNRTLPETPAVPTPPQELNGVTNSPNYFPIPPDYLDVVDLVLNKNFGVRCNPLPDSPSFDFQIIVPEKYSSMTPAQKEMLHADVRSKVITYAEGTNGVQLWCDKVLETFSSDTKFRIVEDRPFAQRPI